MSTTKGAHLQCVCNHCIFLKLLKENCCSYRLHKLSTICVFQADGRTRRWTLFFRQMDGLEDGHCVFRTDGRTRRWTLCFSDRWTLCFSDRWTLCFSDRWMDQKMDTAFLRQMDGLEDGPILAFINTNGYIMAHNKILH